MTDDSPVSTPSPSGSPDLTKEKTLSVADALPIPPPDANFDTEFPEEDYVMLKKVGTGSFGNVFKALHTPSNSIVAVKKIGIDDNIDDIMKESNAMRGLRHDNIVAFYASYTMEREVWIVMEFCTSKSLHDITRDLKRGLNDQEMGCAVRQTVKALAYLHAHNKIHRDLKGANLLMQQDGSLKLADFGVAGELSATISRRHTMIGSPYWMSPEVIEDCGHDQKADIWSLGITIIELAELDPPHFEVGPMRVVFIIPNSPPPELKHKEAYSPELSELLARCLVKNPDERASAEELLKMPYITEAERCRNAFTCAADDKEAIAKREEMALDELEPCCLATIATKACAPSPITTTTRGRTMASDGKGIVSPTETSPTPARSPAFKASGELAKNSMVLNALSDLEASSALNFGVSVRCGECSNCAELKKKVADLERKISELQQKRLEIVQETSRLKGQVDILKNFFPTLSK